VIENPILILKDAKQEVWIKTDRTYAIPKTTYKMLLQSPKTFQTVEDAISASIVESLLKESLHRDYSEAIFLGFDINMDMQFNGLTISFSGYSSKISQLVELTIDRLINLDFSENKFDAIKQSLIRDLETSNKGLSNTKILSILNKMIR